MDKWVEEFLRELLREKFVGAKCVGYRTWLITLNQNEKGHADYQVTIEKFARELVREKEEK